MALAAWTSGCGTSAAPAALGPGGTPGLELDGVFQPATTTLDRSLVTSGTGSYRTLEYGPAWPTQVREELASAQTGRETRREALLCIAHVSDVHVIDAESPLRIEFIRSMKGLGLPRTELGGAWRAHEMLTTHVAAAMVRQLNALARGPITRRPFDLAISTGDNGDNRHQNELEQFITVMDGGTITPSSGDPALYEGVQDDSPSSFDPQYWHPEPGRTDNYKDQVAFPDYPGLLEAAVGPFEVDGLLVPWYSAYGNHDNLLQGNFPEEKDLAPADALEDIATGNRKILLLPLFYALLELGQEGAGVDLFLAEFLDPLGAFHDWPTFIARWNAATTPVRTVTPDPSRHILSRAEFVQAHLDSPAFPGPAGHGFTEDNRQTGNLYYTFEPLPGVLGVTLDTVDPGGVAWGSLGQSQVDWMEDRLREAHSLYYDENGHPVQTGNQDKLVILFSHHHLATLINPVPDPDKPGELRVMSVEFERILHRYPNVVLWVNGHSHICRVFGHPDPSGRTGGFWEVNTPSHIDYPQQSRIIELVNNRDGTLSIFATLVDHAAPPETGPAVADGMRLASISRELCANDPQIDRSNQLGSLPDRNVELLIQAPFAP